MIKKIIIILSIATLYSCSAINDSKVMKKYKEGQNKKTMSDWKKK